MNRRFTQRSYTFDLAEFIKPCIRIDSEDRRRAIKLGRSKYYHSKQDYNKLEEDCIQARVIGNHIRTYINKPVFNLTDIPMYIEDGFFFEHRYFIANFGFFGVSRQDGRMF